MNAILWVMIRPEGIITDFEITGFKKENDDKYFYDKTLTIYLEKKKIIPFEYKTHNHKASIFAEPRLIEYCPIRNMTVTLGVKHRR